MTMFIATGKIKTYRQTDGPTRLSILNCKESRVYQKHFGCTDRHTLYLHQLHFPSLLLFISKQTKPFVALPTDRRTKYLQNRSSFMRGICTKKIERYLNQGPRKSRFPLNVVDRRTDICRCRVALLLTNGINVEVVFSFFAPNHAGLF